MKEIGKVICEFEKKKVQCLRERKLFERLGRRFVVLVEKRVKWRKREW